MDDTAIQELVTRLARRGRGGTLVIERAAILAEGADCTATVAWIIAHAGKPEVAVTSSKPAGLHSARLSGSIGASAQPLRYVLPAGALG